MISDENNLEAIEMGLEETEQVASSVRGKRTSKSRTTLKNSTTSSSKASKSRKRTSTVIDEIEEDDGLMALFFGMEDEEVGVVEVQQVTEEIAETKNTNNLQQDQEFTAHSAVARDVTETVATAQVAVPVAQEEVLEIAHQELSTEQRVQELAPVCLAAESPAVDQLTILQEVREVSAPSATSATSLSVVEVERHSSSATNGVESLGFVSDAGTEQVKEQQEVPVAQQEESHEAQLAQLVAELSDDVAELDAVWGVSAASEIVTTDTNEVVESQSEIETTEVTGAVSTESSGEASVADIEQDVDSVTTESLKDRDSEAATDKVVEEIAVAAIVETAEVTDVIDTASITNNTEVAVVEATETAEVTGVVEAEAADVAGTEATAQHEFEDTETMVAEFVPPLQVDAQPRVLVDSFILPATLGMMSVRGVVGKDTTQEQLRQQVTNQVATPAQTSALLEQALLQQLAKPLADSGTLSNSVDSDSRVGRGVGSELNTHSSISTASQVVPQKLNAQEAVEAPTESESANALNKTTARKQQDNNSAKSQNKEVAQAVAEVNAAAQKKQELDFERKLGFNSLSKLFKVTSELRSWTQAWQDGKLPLPCAVAEQKVAAGTTQGQVGAGTNQGVSGAGTTGATDNARSFIFPWEKVLTSSKELKSLVAEWLADIDSPTLTQSQLMELELWYWIYQYAEQQLGQVLTPSSIEMLSHYLGLVRGVHALGDGLDTSGGVWQVLPHLREIPVAQYQVKDAYAYRNLVSELQAVSPEQVQQRMQNIRKRMTQLRHAQSLQQQLGTSMHQHPTVTSSISSTSSITSAVASRATSMSKEQSDA